jgi:hypothetical protein
VNVNVSQGRASAGFSDSSGVGHLQVAGCYMGVQTKIDLRELFDCLNFMFGER